MSLTVLAHCRINVIPASAGVGDPNALFVFASDLCLTKTEVRGSSEKSDLFFIVRGKGDGGVA